MCDFSKGFKLCTCTGKIEFREAQKYIKKKGKLVALKQNKKQPPLLNIWTLNKYTGKSEDFEIGQYIPPTNDLGKGLEANWLIEELNKKNCFDFDYTPKEGDNLIFSQNVVLSPYISFIFKNDSWLLDHYDPFDAVNKEIETGEIQIVD